MKDNDYELFNFLNPYGNDQLSLMSSNDLQEFIRLASNHKLEYRRQLSSLEKSSFGLEIECEKLKWPVVVQDLDKLDLNYKWDTIRDSSLEKGIEITSPVLNDEESSWEDLYKVCSFLDNRSNSLEKSAAHVHVGAHKLETRESFVNFLRLWSTYENIIFRFGYGENTKERKTISKYAPPVATNYWNKAHTIETFNLSYHEISELLQGSKFSALNFNNLAKYNNIFKKHNTIEFRCANGTLNPIIWQNLVNLYLNIIKVSNNLDSDIVFKRHEIVKRYLDQLNLYDEIFLDQSLEFADLVFDNNIDKTYFLIQYFKGFNYHKDNQSLTKILTRSK